VKLKAIALALLALALPCFAYAVFLDTTKVYNVQVRTVGLPSANFGLYTSYLDGSEVTNINFSEAIQAGGYCEITYFLKKKADTLGSYNMSYYVENLPSYLSLTAYWNNESWTQNSNHQWNVNDTIAISLRLTASTNCESTVANFKFMLQATP